MGEGIAQVAASNGHRVFLFDSRPTAAREAIESIAARLHSSVAKGRRDASEVAAILSRLTIAIDLADLGEADLVIEAIVEDLDVKRTVLLDLDRVLRPDAIIASNTSSISISDIAAGSQHPDRVVGVHFFNPAAGHGPG